MLLMIRDVKDSTSWREFDARERMYLGKIIKPWWTFNKTVLQSWKNGYVEARAPVMFQVPGVHAESYDSLSFLAFLKASDELVANIVNFTNKYTDIIIKVE